MYLLTKLDYLQHNMSLCWRKEENNLICIPEFHLEWDECGGGLPALTWVKLKNKKNKKIII